MLFLGKNVGLLLNFAREYLMRDLKGKCEEFLCRYIAKIRLPRGRWPHPGNSELLDLLVVACDYDLENLQKAIIPKATNYPLSHLEKYFSRIKPTIVIYLQNLMLRKYAPTSIDVKQEDDSHDRRRLTQSGLCYACTISTRYKCSRCNDYLCNNCAEDDNYCGTAAAFRPQKVCNFCKKQACECGANVLQQVMKLVK